MFFQRSAYDSNHKSNTTFGIDQHLSPAFLVVRPCLRKTTDVAEELSILDVAAKVIQTLLFANYTLRVGHESMGKVDNASS